MGPTREDNDGLQCDAMYDGAKPGMVLCIVIVLICTTTKKVH